MSDRLVSTHLLDDIPVEIYERTAMIPNPALGMAMMPTIVETFYVMPAPHWPLVRIRARRGYARLFYWLGRKPGIKLDDPSFTKVFRVDCADEEFAVLLINPRLQAYMLEKTNVDWSAGDGAIKLFYKGKLRENRIERSLKRLRGFRDCIDEEMFSFGVAPAAE